MPSSGAPSSEDTSVGRRRVSSPHPHGKALPAVDLDEALSRAAAVLRGAEALLICSGAGMGVDSGLGTYRGRHAGVWGPLKTLCKDYSEMCDPDWFESDPRLAWAYWRFCSVTYTGAEPHDGYRLLADWGSAMALGVFSVTTNIDGHWERTLGGAKVLECHGSVSRLQRLDGAGGALGIWPADSAELADLVVPDWNLAPGEPVEVRVAEGGRWSPWEPAAVGDDGFSVIEGGRRRPAHGVRRPGGTDLLRVEERSALPRCASDGSLARPNVLMFGDFKFNTGKVEEQRSAYQAWRASLPKDVRLAVVEIGAGLAIPVARAEAEEAVRAFPGATLIRVNLDDAGIGQRFAEGRASVSIGGLGALEALVRIASLLDVPAGESGDAAGGFQTEESRRESSPGP